MRVGHLTGGLAAFSLLIPAAGRIVGRNFNTFGISSEEILSDSSRTNAAILAFIFVATLLFLRSVDGILVPRSIPKTFQRAIIFFLVVFVFSNLLALMSGNPLHYIISDNFTMGFWLVTMALGYMIGTSAYALDGFVLGFALLGLGVISYELLTAIGAQSLLLVRYGSGLGLPVMAVASIALTAYGHRKWVFGAILIGTFYVFGSNSRAAAGILVVTLLMFFWLRRHIDPISQKFSMRRVLVSSIALAAVMVLAINLSGLLASDTGSSAFSSMLSRIAGTVSVSSNVKFRVSDLENVRAMQHVLDASTWLRFVEAVSVLESLKSYVYGNGLGATFDNARAQYLNVSISDHYIHLTPILLLFRQGFIGIAAWITVFFGFISFYFGSMKSEDFRVRVSTIIALILLMQTAFDFPVASGAFFVDFAIASAFIGVSLGRQAFLFWRRLPADAAIAGSA